MYTPYLDAALLIWAYMTLLFFLALIRRDNSIVDIAWGLGFTILAWWMHFMYPHVWSILPTVLISMWGIRLALYIGIRNTRSKREDWRYANWRRAWGKWLIPRSYFQVFMLQGFFMWLISFSFLQRPAHPKLEWFQWIGILFWTVGFLWEAVGDWQLSRFKSDPVNQGKVMNKGLWQLSRHPNYFGEVVLWWGMWLITISYGQWWISLISPVTITWLLMRVSGVPMLERKYKDNPEYQAYIKKTPAFFPDLSKWRKN